MVCTHRYLADCGRTGSGAWPEGGSRSFMPTVGICEVRERSEHEKTADPRECYARLVRKWNAVRGSSVPPKNRLYLWILFIDHRVMYYHYHAYAIHTSYICVIRGVRCNEKPELPYPPPEGAGRRIYRHRTDPSWLRHLWGNCR